MKRENIVAELEVIDNGCVIHFKEFLVSRGITKISDDEYEIDDCSDGWVTATVNKETVIKLIMGEENWLNLNWR